MRLVSSTVHGCFALAAMTWACAGPLVAAAPPTDADSIEPIGPAPKIETPSAPGGWHRALRTSRGAVHVFVPQGYEAETAGLVLYVHGYYTDVDTAWRRHRLAQQFAASARNAMFIAPEAPIGELESVSWESLPELLAEVSGRIEVDLPRGRRIAVAHSGGNRTVRCWLDAGLDTVVLLDALYGAERELRAWLDGAPYGERRLFIVAYETASRSERFISDFDDARVLDAVPPLRDIDPRLTGQRLIFMHSQYDHMRIVTAQRVIPAVLQLTRVERLPE